MQRPKLTFTWIQKDVVTILFTVTMVGDVRYDDCKIQIIIDGQIDEITT